MSKPARPEVPDWRNALNQVPVLRILHIQQTTARLLGFSWEIKSLWRRRGRAKLAQADIKGIETLEAYSEVQVRIVSTDLKAVIKGKGGESDATTDQAVVAM
eukprot:4141805-Pleurochrysis_carterae.AAC.1